MNVYSADFYKHLREGSLRSAKAIIPILLELLQPKSIIDVGCGDGTWLSVFKDYGIEDILGVDGDWVDGQLLQISPENYLSSDLTKPLELHRKFDLVVSLEVAEHLPKSYAETFVDSLVRLGPCILFSAAVPGQGGTNHLNEQWQDVWAQYFQAKGYVAIDCIRKHIWNNDQVEFWYCQNILIYAKRDLLQIKPLLQEAYTQSHNSMLALVHPRLYIIATSSNNMYLRKVLSMLPRLIIRSIKDKIRIYFN